MQVKSRVPIRDGIFTTPLENEAAIRLAGVQCRSCGEVFFGNRTVCENCSAQAMERLAFSRHGVLWSYTVISHEPPPGYKVPPPFKPYGLGLVELPEGIRILAPIDCESDRLVIGMKLESVIYPLYVNDQGAEVMAFKFKPAESSK